MAHKRNSFFDYVKDKFINFYYALGFGIKTGGDILVTSNASSDDGGITIEQQVQQENVYTDLLKGVVTQEVEELRYGTFKAEEEAMDYKYIGNGLAEKQDIDEETKRNNRKHFNQPNFQEEYSIAEIEKMGPKDAVLPPEKYTIKINYENPNVKFKLERYATNVEVWCDEKRFETKLIFKNEPTDRKARPFINTLKRTALVLETLSGESKEAYVAKSEILRGVDKLEFITFKASNNVPNGIEHCFMELKDSTIESNEFETEWYITYKWKSHKGGKLLSEKYYNKEKDLKYKEKRKKENYTIDLGKIKASSD